MTGQNVQNDTGGMDIVCQRLGAGGIDGVQAIGEHGGKDIDHLPVATWLAFQLALYAPQSGRQIPRLERRSVAQGAGFAGQDGYVMQGIVDGVVAPEDTLMAADDPTILPAFQPIGIGSDLDRPPHRAGIDRVSVLVEADQAGI